MSDQEQRKGFKPYYERDAGNPDSQMPTFMAQNLFNDLLVHTHADQSLLDQLGQRTASAWARGDLRLWNKKVRLALHLLKKVQTQHQAKLGELIAITLEAYQKTQKTSYFAKRESRAKAEEEEPELRFPALLAAYLQEFEGVYRDISSIFAFAKESVFNNPHSSNSAEWYLQQSAKTKASKLDSPLSLGAEPINVLIEGYDRHFRNSIAHHRYRFSDRNTVEMWDVNEQGKETWRDVFHYEECEARLENLHSTVTALEAAYFLYATRNKHLLGKFAGHVPGKQTTEERNIALYETAKRSYQLEVKDIIDDQQGLTLKVQVIPNHTLDQIEEMYIGGGRSGPQAFDIVVKTFEVPLTNVIFGFAREIADFVPNTTRLTIVVSDSDGGPAGEVVLNADQLAFLQKANDKQIPVEKLPSEKNSLTGLKVKFTRRSAPHPKKPKRSDLILPPEKKIIVPHSGGQHH